MDDYKIVGFSDELTNIVLNGFICSQEKDETQRKTLLEILKVFNKYGVPTHKAIDLIGEMNEILSDGGVNNG